MNNGYDILLEVTERINDLEEKRQTFARVLLGLQCPDAEMKSIKIYEHECLSATKDDIEYIVTTSGTHLRYAIRFPNATFALSVYSRSAAELFIHTPNPTNKVRKSYVKSARKCQWLIKPQHCYTDSIGIMYASDVLAKGDIFANLIKYAKEYLSGLTTADIIKIIGEEENKL